MTLQEMRDALTNGWYPTTNYTADDGVVVTFLRFRSHGFMEVPQEMVVGAFDELVKRLDIVRMGVGEITQRDILLYLLFCEFTGVPR